VSVPTGKVFKLAVDRAVYILRELEAEKARRVSHTSYDSAPVSKLPRPGATDAATGVSHVKEMGKLPPKKRAELKEKKSWNRVEELKVPGSVQFKPALFSDMLYRMTIEGSGHTLSGCDLVGKMLVTTLHPNTTQGPNKVQLGDHWLVGRCQNMWVQPIKRVWSTERCEVIRIDASRDRVYLRPPTTEFLKGFKPRKPAVMSRDMDVVIAGVDLETQEASGAGGVASPVFSDGDYTHRVSTNNGHSACAITDPDRKNSYGLHLGYVQKPGRGNLGRWSPFTESDVVFCTTGEVVGPSSEGAESLPPPVVHLN
jgi:hypothetical protein